MNTIWIIRSVSFLSAFLLFQIEFIVGKILLPKFGGSFMVWGACIVFFQAALLLGYMYAHYAIQSAGIVRYRKFHVLLLLLPLLFFPGRPLTMQYTLKNWPMVIEVFRQLMLTIGPVFFVLSTMSIVSQSWLSRSHLPERNNPYILFGVSNVGSFMALLTYPFVFEMFFDLHVQQNIWRIGYIFVVALYLLALKFISVRQEEKRKKVLALFQINSLVGRWFFYGVAGVMMFLAVTNLATVEIAPVPLFWMLPLLIYLLSYVLNFKKKPWCPRWIENQIHFIVAFGVLLYFIMIRQVFPTLLCMVTLLLFLFVVCLFCQKRLYALRPDPRELTHFYFIISLGGFCGGLISTWIVPLVSPSHLEYFLALFFVYLAWQMDGPKTSFSALSLILIAVWISSLYVAPYLLSKFQFRGFIGWIIFVGFILYQIRKSRFALLIGLLFVTIFMNTLEPLWFKQKYVLSQRNYYGINRILEARGIRFLTQGFTVHGAQFLDSQRSYIPLTYYNPRSPGAELLIKEGNIKRVGIIGLGTGALATYLKRGQSLNFFELDPDVLNLAKKYFTFLKISRGSILYTLGDARLSLERLDQQNYNLLVVDAFSGDSVPIHLLTVEAIEVYRRHLADGGIVLLHLTNRYINLPQAFIDTAATTKAYIAFKQDDDYISHFFNSDWVALTWDQKTYLKLIGKYRWSAVKRDSRLRPWTDNYSNIIPYFLNFKGILASLKEWKKW